MNEIKLIYFPGGLHEPPLEDPPEAANLSSPCLLLHITLTVHSATASEHGADICKREIGIFLMKRTELDMDLTCNEIGWLKNCHAEKLGQLNSIRPFKKRAGIRIKVENLITTE